MLRHVEVAHTETLQKKQQACTVLFPFMVPDLQLPAQGRHFQYNFASRALQFD